jgi:hypothetical protein
MDCSTVMSRWQSGLAAAQQALAGFLANMEPMEELADRCLAIR